MLKRFSQLKCLVEGEKCVKLTLRKGIHTDRRLESEKMKLVVSLFFAPKNPIAIIFKIGLLFAKATTDYITQVTQANGLGLVCLSVLNMLSAWKSTPWVV